MKYYRLTDGLNRVGRLIPEINDPYEYVDNQDKDWYLSVYKYDDEQKKKADSNGGSVKGITDVVTNKLIFDVDCKDNIEKARKDGVEICNRLVSKGFDKDSLTISFSGNKGFSIVIDHDKEITPEQHKAIAKTIAGDLETFDPKNYNASRIFRLDFTKHNESGLYKTPITYNQFERLSIDKIKDISKQKRKPRYSIKKTELPEIKVEVKPEPRSDQQIDHRLDFSKKPYYLTDVKYALHKGFIPPGKGNEGMMILAAAYRHTGFDKMDAYHILKGVNEKRSEIYNIDKRSNEDIWNQVINTVYSADWKGGTYSPKENELLQETATTFNITEKSALVDIKQIGNRFIDFASNINKNVIRTGVKSLDDSILITTGMMIGQLGAPSSGKTSFAISFIENLSEKGQVTLFESLDMYDNLLYQRLAQRVSGVKMDEKLRMMIEDDPKYDPTYEIKNDKEVNDAFDLVAKKYRNVEFNSSRGATLETIEEDIKLCKSKHGDKLKLVVIDYLEKVRGPYSDATANSGFVASRLSDLASTYDVAVLVLLQPQKSAGDPSEELLSMRKVKGASVIEQDCRVILTLWRPGFNPKDTSDDKFASIAIVKNNMGEVKQLDFSWNGAKGELNELTDSERFQLEDLRDRIKEQKEEERKNDF